MGRSIQEMYDKFKYALKDDGFFYGMLIVLVALSAFGLGKWSNTYIEPNMLLQSTEKSLPASIPVSMTQVSTTSVTNTVIETDGLYVGSKNGSKYHLLTCPGAKQIKEENKVFFNSKEDAQKVGYSPAGNCKGI